MLTLLDKSSKPSRRFFHRYFVKPNVKPNDNDIETLLERYGEDIKTIVLMANNGQRLIMVEFKSNAPMLFKHMKKRFDVVHPLLESLETDQIARVLKEHYKCSFLTFDSSGEIPADPAKLFPYGSKEWRDGLTNEDFVRCEW